MQVKHKNNTLPLYENVKSVILIFFCTFMPEFNLLLHMKRNFFFFFILITGCIMTSCSEKLVKVVNHLENGELKIIEYLDINGNIVERNRMQGDVRVLFEEYVYIDNIIRAARFEAGDEMVSSVEYFYEDNILRRTRYFLNGAIYRLVVYRYDEMNRLFAEMQYDLRNELRNVTHFHYDVDGRLIAKVSVTKDSLPTQEFYNYDSQNNMVKSLKVYGSDTISMSAYAFNKKNLMIEHVEYQHGNLVKKVKYSYNPKGQLNKILYFDNVGYIVREEKTSYTARGLKNSLIITDYRNFEGDGKKVVDVWKYKYVFF
jgi:uncharacterized protein YkuJ